MGMEIGFFIMGMGGNGNGNSFMGMGGNGNRNSSSRTPLIHTAAAQLTHEFHRTAKHSVQSSL